MGVSTTFEHTASWDATDTSTRRGRGSAHDSMKQKQEYQANCSAEADVPQNDTNIHHRSLRISKNEVAIQHKAPHTVQSLCSACILTTDEAYTMQAPLPSYTRRFRRIMACIL
jgi:hypothetical protein